MAEFSLQALHDEIVNDPNGYGLTALGDAGSTGDIAALLNEVRQSININRGPIPAYEIINAVDPTDWLALSADQKLLFQTLTGAGTVDAGDANVVAAFVDMFGGTGSITALAGVKDRDGSRAEQLFGRAVTHTDVARALEV